MTPLDLAALRRDINQGRPQEILDAAKRLLWNAEDRYLKHGLHMKPVVIVDEKMKADLERDGLL